MPPGDAGQSRGDPVPGDPAPRLRHPRALFRPFQARSGGQQCPLPAAPGAGRHAPGSPDGIFGKRPLARAQRPGMALRVTWSAPGPEGPIPARSSGAAGGACASQKSPPSRCSARGWRGGKDCRSRSSAPLEARAGTKAASDLGASRALGDVSSVDGSWLGGGGEGVRTWGSWAAAPGTRTRHSRLFPGAHCAVDAPVPRAASTSSPALKESSSRRASGRLAGRSPAALRSTQSSSAEWAEFLLRLHASAAGDGALDQGRQAQAHAGELSDARAVEPSENAGPSSKGLEQHAEGRAARTVLVLLDLPETLLPEKVRVLVEDEGLPAQSRRPRPSRRRRQPAIQAGGYASEQPDDLGGRLGGASGDAKPDSMAVRLQVFHDFGFSVDDLRQLLRCRPVVLRRSAAFVRSKLQYLLDLGVSREALPRVARNSNWARFDPKEELPAKIAYLESVGVHSAGALLERCPRLLTLSLPCFLENEAILREALGHDLFLALVLRNPKAFVFPRDTLVSLVHLLTSRFGFGAEDLQSVLCRLTLMPCGSKALLSERMAALAEAVGDAGVVQAIKKFPGLVCSSPENIREVTQGLRALLSEAEARGAAQRDPQVLAYNWERKLQPVIEFCGRELGLTPGEVLWSYAYIRSLEKAVAPRILFLKAAGVKVYVGDGRKRATDDSTLGGGAHGERISLRAVANLSSAQFRERYPMYAGE